MKTLLRFLLSATALTGALGWAGAASAQSTEPAADPAQRHNLILFVADGLRNGSVSNSLAPTLHKLKNRGVYFENSHSIFPTFTTANASAMATGHYLGDTGDFSNTIFADYPVQSANGSLTPFVENDVVLGDIDDHFMSTLKAGKKDGKIETGYLDEETILAAARAAGYSTAAVGKVGPVAIFDHENSPLVQDTSRDTRGTASIFVDDATGSANGIPLDADFAAALAAAGIPTVTPGRGANGPSGNNDTPGTKVPNLIQQDYFVQVVSDVLLPRLKAKDAPFVMVFWSRDPDGTQHNQGDSLNKVTPGINGRTSEAAVSNADSDLSRLMDALDRLKLTSKTDIVVTSDHGFSTISKNPGPDFTPSQTSYASTQTYQAYRLVDGETKLVREVEKHFLPVGFLAIDLAHFLDKPLHDPDSAPASAPRPITPDSYLLVDPTQPPPADGSRRQRPGNGNGVIGDVNDPAVVVAANGGSDLIYLPNKHAAEIAAKIIPFLQSQDYVSGLFVDQSLGSFDGTLPLADINLQGKAITPVPAIVVNFASASTRGKGCKEDTDAMCGVEIADSGLQQGQGMHGGFSRADTYNFMAAIGPDFRKGYVDAAPASNADIGKTIAAVLQLDVPNKGELVGRPLSEALQGGGDTPEFSASTVKSKPGVDGVRTVIKMQSVGDTRYFDAAGFPGRTVGLD